MKGYIIYISPCKRERYGDTPTSNSFVALKILYIKWNLVVRGSWSSFFMYLQYCIVVQICCTCAVNKNTRRTTGTRRAPIHGHLKAAHWCAKNAANTLLRSRASRGHLNLFSSNSELPTKDTLPCPNIHVPSFSAFSCLIYLISRLGRSERY